MIRYYSVPKETFVTNGTIVEPLNVTENGTYAPPAGTAYSPVTVNVEGGGSGGETWNTVFEGNVSIDDETEIDGLSAFNADIIKVTFNGTEYTCERQIYDDTVVFYGAPPTDDDFSTYPFIIYFGKDQETFIQTETAGTYTLKIEEPQSGGSSDFSTAKVTFNLTGVPSQVSLRGCLPSLDGGGYNEYENPLPTALIPMSISISGGTTEVYTVPLYKGKAYYENTGLNYLAVTGNAELYYPSLEPEEGVVPDGVIISGDCTITFAQQ